MAFSFFPFLRYKVSRLPEFVFSFHDVLVDAGRQQQNKRWVVVVAGVYVVAVGEEPSVERRSETEAASIFV